MRFQLVLAAVATVAITTSAHARDRSASFDELSKVFEALKAAGCASLQKLEVEESGYEAEGVICDGEKYEIKLDQNFAIVSKRKDRF